MLEPSRCSVSWADEPFFRAAQPGTMLSQQQFSMLHSGSQSAGEARTKSSSRRRNRESGSLAASSGRVVSRPGWLEGGFGRGPCSLDGGKFTRSTVAPREGRRRTMMGASRGDDRSGFWKKADLNATQVLESVEVRVEGDLKKVDVVDVQIENLGNNSRKIVAKITIEAPLDNVWAILTDYEHLADFIPGLAVNQLLERRHNGARLYQVGEQNIALGVKFKAKAVVDCVEKPTTFHEGCFRRDIDFDTVEGDFEIFRGTWRMEQPTTEASSDLSAAVAGGRLGDAGERTVTILSYILVVQPKIWLPVALVEGRLASEMKSNLICIREVSLQPSLQ